jgi:hypothetical protein
MPDIEDQTTPEKSPESGDEISKYLEGYRQLEMQGYETGIKKARTALFVTAGLIFGGEMISAAITNIPITPLLLGIALIEAGIFVGLALWTKKRPYAAIVTGLVIFILLWIFSIVVLGGKAAYSGIIVRIIIISYMVSAIKPAKAWEDTKKMM